MPGTEPRSSSVHIFVSAQREVLFKFKEFVFYDILYTQHYRGGAAVAATIIIIYLTGGLLTVSGRLTVWVKLPTLPIVQGHRT
jgi:hypothetical protein